MARAVTLVALAALLGCRAVPGASAVRATAPRPAVGSPRGLLETAQENLRLDDSVVPVGYELTLAINPDMSGFSGTIAIDVQVRTTTSLVWLNALDLSVGRAAVVTGSAPQTARVVSGPPGSELIGLALDAPLTPGSARLAIDFAGTLGSHHGLFRQRFGGRWYAYSDFEATDARRAFPCFDDPRFKTPWQITVVAPSGLQALSNAPLAAADRPKAAVTRHRFAATRPLPSYLVAVAVGPFELVDAGASRVPVRIAVPRGTASRARYAAAATPELLALAEDYLGLPMPFPKLDLVAVPELAGAMENPGLVTFGAHILLLDPDRPTLAAQRLFAMVAAHEIAHMWFGDLVTPAWWDDLWLNEGFATWLADELVAAWRPTWGWDIEAIDGRNAALAVDEAPGVRAIRRPIAALNQIRASFDTLTYKKGGALLRMAQRWLGHDVFMAGVRAYLTEYADGNADAGDLLAALSVAAASEVGGALASFLGQGGAPVIQAELRCDRGRPPRVSLRQQRYAPLASPSSDQLWHVPVCVRHPEATDCTLLDRAEATVPLTAARCPTWVHPNADGAGYYRFSLPPAGLRALAGAGAALRPTERADLVASLGAGLRSGALTLDDVLAAVTALAPEAGYGATLGLVGLLELLDQRLVTPAHREAFGAMVALLYGERAVALGMTPRSGESVDATLSRAAVVTLAGLNAPPPPLIELARARADAWARDRTEPAGPLVAAALAVATRAGDAAWFSRLEAVARAPGREDRRFAALLALAQVGAPALIERAIGLVEARLLGLRERLTLLEALFGNPLARDRAWQFLRDELDALSAQIPRDLLPVLAGVTRPLCSAAQAREVDQAFRARLSGDPQRLQTLAAVVRDIESCAAFREHHATAAERLW